MIEILFKAKRYNWSELPEQQHWVTGYYWTNGLGNHFIRVTFENDEFTIKDYEIDPNTLYQYTNMDDGFDDKIFENDYVKFEDVGKEGFVNEFIRLTNQDKKDTDSYDEILGIEAAQQRILSI